MLYEFIFKKDIRFESRIPNGKRSNGKRSFLYVLARTKKQCIERVQAICKQNKPHGYCFLRAFISHSKYYLFFNNGDHAHHTVSATIRSCQAP